MSRNNTYGGVIWTEHALERLRERGIKQGDAWAAWRRPDHSRYAESQGGWIYSKKLHNEIIEVVAKKNEKREWLILSVWSKPMYARYNKKQDGLLKRLVRFLLN